MGTNALDELSERQRRRGQKRALRQLRKFLASLGWPVTRWATVVDVFRDPDVGSDYGRGVGLLFALLVGFWLCLLVMGALMIDKQDYWSAFTIPAVLLYFFGTLVSFETSHYES